MSIIEDIMWDEIPFAYLQAWHEKAFKILKVRHDPEYEPPVRTKETTHYPNLTLIINNEIPEKDDIDLELETCSSEELANLLDRCNIEIRKRCGI